MAIRTALGAQRYNDKMHRIFATAAALNAKHDQTRAILQTLVREACGVEVGYDNEALNRAFHALLDAERA